jgi:hypothetical protein
VSEGILGAKETMKQGNREWKTEGKAKNLKTKGTN